MEACGFSGEDHRTVEGYEFVSCPNRSLSHGQQRLAFWGVAIPCIGIASVFAALGYWPVLPFAGVEIGLLGWGFARLRAHDGDYESITIHGYRLSLEWRYAGETHRRDLSTHWLHVECMCEKGENGCRFCLRLHGEAIELGRYLDDRGRVKLAEAVRAHLSKNR